ncbi:MAG: hypothetical protein RLZ12_139 [Bacillota bacterium]
MSYCSRSCGCSSNFYPYYPYTCVFNNCGNVCSCRDSDDNSCSCYKCSCRNVKGSYKVQDVFNVVTGTPKVIYDSTLTQCAKPSGQLTIRNDQSSTGNIVVVADETTVLIVKPGECSTVKLTEVANVQIQVTGRDTDAAGGSFCIDLSCPTTR